MKEHPYSKVLNHYANGGLVRFKARDASESISWFLLPPDVYNFNFEKWMYKIDKGEEFSVKNFRVVQPLRIKNTESYVLIVAIKTDVNQLQLANDPRWYTLRELLGYQYLDKDGNWTDIPV